MRAPSSQTAQGALETQMAPEIERGRLLRSLYASQSGQPVEQLVREEMRPDVSYTAQKGMLSTDEPPYEVYGSSQSDLNLVRKPMYEELLKQLNP